MNNRNQQQTTRTPAPVQQSLPASALTYLNVFTVEEYESNGKTQKRWTRIGAAFPHKEGPGLSIELRAFPVDGRLVVLPPDNDDRSKQAQCPLLRGPTLGPAFFLTFAASHASITAASRSTLRSSRMVNRDLFCSQSATALTSLCRLQATISAKRQSARR
jgi:hypothetical protein